MVVVDNRSDYRVLVSVGNKAIPAFDAAPVLVSPASEEKWLRGARERVVVMSRHGWVSCPVGADGYVRITNKNLYVVGDWEDLDSHYYTWFDDQEVDLSEGGFPFSMEEVREICHMEHTSSRQANGAAADCGFSAGFSATCGGSEVAASGA